MRIVLIFSVFLFAALPAFAEESKAKSKPIQEDAYYSPTMGFVKASSVRLDPVSDYLENEHRKYAAKQEAEHKSVKSSAEKSSKKKAKRASRKVLVS